MAVKRPSLGRGLDALLGAATAPPTASTEIVKKLPVDLIRPGPFQPRRHFDPEALAELADSIRAQGVVQPIVVRSRAGGGYELIAGERRWRAAGLAGLAEIPAVLRELPDQAALAVGLIENIQREDLNALEQAEAYARLIDEFGLTHQETATAVGRSRAAVTNLLRLRELAPEAKRLLADGQLEMGHARALLALPALKQATLARDVAAQRLSVRETERRVQRLLAAAPRTGPARTDPDTRALEHTLSERLGAKVELRSRAQGHGTLLIHYRSLDELVGVLARIG